MITEPKTLRARLLDNEPVSPAYRRQLEQEINDMFNYNLSRGGRWYWGVSLAASVLFAALGAAVLTWGRMDGFIATIWWIYTLANAGFVFLAAQILRSGRLDVQRLAILGKLSPALTLVITLLAFAGAINRPTIETVLWVIFCIIWLLMSVAITVYFRVVAAEFRQREQVLRMELRLEELIERLGPGDEGLGVGAGIR